MTNGYILICNDCGFRGGETDFEMSLADECFCPKCNNSFLFVTDEDDDDEATALELVP